MKPFSSPIRKAALKNLVNIWSVLLDMCVTYCVIWPKQTEIMGND